jgi:hypothetical protein
MCCCGGDHCLLYNTEHAKKTPFWVNLDDVWRTNSCCCKMVDQRLVNPDTSLSMGTDGGQYLIQGLIDIFSKFCNACKHDRYKQAPQLQ